MKESDRRHQVLLLLPAAQDVSAVQDVLAGFGAEGSVCADVTDLCRRLAGDVDAVLLAEQVLADGALSSLAEALSPQPPGSNLPVLIVAAGGAAGDRKRDPSRLRTPSPLIEQAMRQLPNVLILHRPVHQAVLSSALRMALHARDNQRQICTLLRERAQDIAERQRAEEALREGERRYRRLFEAPLAGAYITKVDGTIVDFNDAMMQMLGYDSREELLRKNSAELYADPELRKELVRLLQKDGVVPSREAVLKRKDGTLLYALGSAVLLTDGPTGEMFIQGVAVDITERKQAERALRNSERRFRKLFEADLMGVFVTKPDGTFLDCNETMVKILGYDSREEVLRHRSSDLYVDPEFRREAVRILEKEGVYHGREGRVWRKDGSIAHLLGAAVLLKDEETGELYIQGVAVDITERKWAEEALRVSEQRLRAVLENSLDVVYRRDLRTDRYEYISPMAEQILGFTPAEMNEMSVEEVLARVHPDDVGRMRQELSAAAVVGRGKIEYRFRRKDGQFRWLADYFTVQKSEDGQPLYYNGVVRDIAPYKHMEEQLRRLNDRLEEEVQTQTKELRDSIDRLREEATRRVLAEGRLRRRSQMLEAFFQHTISPLAFLDKQFNFVRVNEAFAKAAGKAPRYFVGKNYFALYPHAEHRTIFEQVVQARQPYRAYAKVLTFSAAPQRGVTYWNWWLTPLLDDAGEVQSLVLNLEDVTERQKAFSELEERARQLQQLTLELSQAEDRERKRLAEVLHDDLQQLLAAAKFHLGLLSRGLGEEQELGELAELVKDLLKQAIDRSRSLSHELSPPGLAHTDLQETLEWLVEQVRIKHGLAIHLDIRDRTELASEPLRAFLYKATQEMLFNVIKHAQVKEAQLRLRRRHGCIYLAVSDKGRGFDPQTIATAGFGLQSIRERVQMLGGRMKIWSVRGRGSTFLIAIPDPGLPTGETQERPAEQAAAGLSTRRKHEKGPGDHVLRVLLVDDHKIVRQGIESMLVGEPDIEIVGQAGNGREAVDLACQLHPDVVVMDVAMPVMGGDEATRRIRLHLPETRVIALSMFDDTRVAERMRRAGAIAYLLKTAPSEDLLAAIRGGPKAVTGVS